MTWLTKLRYWNCVYVLSTSQCGELTCQGLLRHHLARSLTTGSTANPRLSCFIAGLTPCVVHLGHICLSRSGSTRGETRYVIFHVPGCHLLHVADMKNARIAFFLFLNFAMIAPMVQLFYQHGYEKGSKFVGECLPVQPVWLRADFQRLSG